MQKLRARGGAVFRGAAGTTFALMALSVASMHANAASTPASAVADSPGCHAHTLAANDDESTGLLSLGFTVNFFGKLYNHLYVNNNGNVSFGNAVSEYTPDGLSAPGHFPTLAPFWADVDTSGPGSGLVTYGATKYNADAAFCVLWPMVGYFSSHTDRRNDFQLLIVDRSDEGKDSFDFIFNYNQIRWESGDDSGGADGLGGQCARAGYTNGTGRAGEHDEIPGSGRCGALLDSNATTGLTQTSLNSGTRGQFVFSVRNGLVSAAGSCLDLASCFSGAGAAGLAVGGAALVTFVGIGGVGVIRAHAPVVLQPVHASVAAGAAPVGHTAMAVPMHGAGAPQPPPLAPASHLQGETGSRVFEAGGTGLEIGMQSVEERAALEAMADAPPPPPPPA
ncbi:MAG TPA: nidogen-like domain-containing protein [Candidatus Dormibacteraeota bacterium]